MKAPAQFGQVLHQTKSPAGPQFPRQVTGPLCLLLTQLHNPKLIQVAGALCVARHNVEDQRVKVVSRSWDGGFWEEAVVWRRVPGLREERSSEEKRREENSVSAYSAL